MQSLACFEAELPVDFLKYNHTFYELGECDKEI